jgi:hypothetical protein
MTVSTAVCVEFGPLDGFIYVGYRWVTWPREEIKSLLSSKSEKRFRVSFQTRNAMIPMTATPPATERPIIEPVPRAVLSPELALEVAEGDAVAVFEGVSVTIVVTW